LLLFRSVNAEMMAKINVNLPVIHIATGVIKDSPLYKSNGITGEKHLLSAPSQTIVCKALESFPQHIHSFAKATFVVDDTKKSRAVFKKWTIVEGTRSDQLGSPMIAFTWDRPPVENETVYRYSTEEQTMQFRGTVEKQPVKILLDTRASGTAFIDMQFCKDENIPLYPAPPGIHTVFWQFFKSSSY
jgi:hypothetical protein